MIDKNFVIRIMKRKEIDFAVQLAAKEGWNPGLYDADCFYAADPNGFLIGLLDDEPIGCISAVSYKNQFGFIGFYIIKPGFRGKGYGIKLWNKAVEYLKDVPVSGLDGVVDQQSNYMKSGFKLAYRNIRFEKYGADKINSGTELIRASEIPFEMLAEYDAKFFPAPRIEFLKCWLNQPESLCLIDFENGKISGYGLIRKCGHGYKVGPLFAENIESAGKIYDALASFAGISSTVYLDVPEVNKSAVELAGRYEMKKVFETARMYTGSEPVLPVNKIFGVTTFELG